MHVSTPREGRREPVGPVVCAVAVLVAACTGPDRERPPSAREADGGVASRDGAAGEGRDGGSGAAGRARRGVPAGVRLEGVPEIPEALRQRLAQYLNTRRASLEAIADDGSRLLVTTRFGETDQVHEVRAPLGARRQLTFGDEPVRQAEYAADGSDAFLFMTDVGGTEDFQIARMDRATGRTTLLTDGRSRHGAYVQSGDGRRIAYTGNARNGRDMDLYLGDGRSASAGELLLEREGTWWAADFSPDGRRLLVGHYVSINDSRLHIVDLESREVRRVTPEEPLASYRDARFGADGDHLYVTTDREGEHVELYEVDLQPEEPTWTPLSRGIPWNVEQIALTGDGETLAFTTNEDGLSSLRLLDTRSHRSQPVPAPPRGVITGLRFARAAPVLAFTVEGATQSGDVYVYDLRTAELGRWTESEMGGLDPSTFVEPTVVRYPAFDDRQIPAFYYRPPGDGPFPVVVSIHGGPESQARPWFIPFYQYLLAESGVAVVAPNVRGSDGYGKSYLLLDNGRDRQSSVRDIGALLDWIRGQPELDESRVAVYGGSYGGYMVLASLVEFGDRIDAGIDIVGITNFVSFLGETRDYRQDLRRAEYGDERDPEMRAFLESISPLTHADRIRSALLVAHGANDPRVPVGESEQLVRAVRASGHDVWYMVADNEGHGFRRKENRDLFVLLSVLFLDRRLGRQPSAEPQPTAATE